MTSNTTRTDELMSIIEEYGSLCHEAGTHRFHDGATQCARALSAIRLAVESMAADSARLDSGRIALWGPGEFFDAETGRRENVQTEHSGVDLRKAIDEAIEMATPEWRAMYCVP